MQNEVPFICNKRLVKVQEPVDADGTYLLNHVQPVRALDPSVCSCGPRGHGPPRRTFCKWTRGRLWKTRL